MLPTGRQEQSSQGSWGLDLLQAMLVRRPNMMDDLVVHGLLYELGWLSTAGIVGMIVTIVAPLAIPAVAGCSVHDTFLQPQQLN
jgi:hypothetical protein